MMNRKGFTLIELLIVVVIIGILAAIAIPKFAATKDKAKVAALKTDLRNYETAQEAYFSDNPTTYATLAQLATASGFELTKGNSSLGENVSATGYDLTITNTSITSTPKQCKVQVGSGGVGVDGVIVCT